MLIRCPECRFERQIDENAIPANAAMATCPHCQYRFRFRNPDGTPVVDEDGNKRKATEIVANDVNFADSKRSDSGANYGAPSAPSYGNNYGSNSAAGNEMQRPAYSEPAPTYSSGNSGDFEEIIGDDDLPF